MSRRLLITLISLFMFAGIASAGSSESNRKDSWVMATINPIGIDARKITGAMPIDVGIYLGDSFILGGTAASGTFNDTENKDDGTKTELEITYSETGGFLRAFPGNSFNFFASYNERTWDAKIVSSDGVASLTGKFQAVSTVAMFGVGNLWILDSGITIGADWIFAGTAVGDPSTAVTITTSSYAPADLQKEIDRLTKYAEDANELSASPGIANLYIGFSF